MLNYQNKKNIINANYECARTLVAKNKHESDPDYIVDDFEKILNIPIINKIRRNKEFYILENNTKNILDIVPMSFMFMSSFGLFTSIINIVLCIKAFTKKLKTWQTYYFSLVLMLSIPLSMFILEAYIHVISR